MEELAQYMETIRLLLSLQIVLLLCLHKIEKIEISTVHFVYVNVLWSLMCNLQVQIILIKVYLKFLMSQKVDFTLLQLNTNNWKQFHSIWIKTLFISVIHVFSFWDRNLGWFIFPLIPSGICDYIYMNG